MLNQLIINKLNIFILKREGCNYCRDKITMISGSTWNVSEIKNSRKETDPPKHTTILPGGIVW